MKSGRWVNRLQTATLLSTIELHFSNRVHFLFSSNFTGSVAQLSLLHRRLLQPPQDLQWIRGRALISAHYYRQWPTRVHWVQLDGHADNNYQQILWMRKGCKSSSRWGGQGEVIDVRVQMQQPLGFSWYSKQKKKRKWWRKSHSSWTAMKSKYQVTQAVQQRVRVQWFKYSCRMTFNLINRTWEMRVFPFPPCAIPCPNEHQLQGNGEGGMSLQDGPSLCWLRPLGWVELWKLFR